MANAIYIGKVCKSNTTTAGWLFWPSGTPTDGCSPDVHGTRWGVDNLKSMTS